MATAWLYGSPLQGMYEFGMFVFSTAALSTVFALIFLALFLNIFGPEGNTGEVHRRLRPKALETALRHHQSASLQQLPSSKPAAKRSSMLFLPEPGQSQLEEARV